MEIIIVLSIGVMAFLYASVGHGGASGYLAVMAIFGFTMTTMKPTALLLNIVVSFISFMGYYIGGYFDFKKFMPFAITSIPFSFLGGLMTIDDQVYKIILGFVLLMATARLLLNIEVQKSNHLNFTYALIIGSTIGFLSGLLGIGGGIILTPILLLMGWADLKQSAAISGLFIFLNSISGLIAYHIKGFEVNHQMIELIIIAFIGGSLGTYFGVRQFNIKSLKVILAFVLLIATFKLIFS
jgi:uncharacterized protein